MQLWDAHLILTFGSDNSKSTFYPGALLNNASLIIKAAKPADELIGYNAPITVIITDRTCSC